MEFVKAPTYLRVAGGMLFVLGALNLVAGLLTLGEETDSRGVIAANVAVSLFLIAVGAGLVLQQRWAWPLAVVCGAAGVGFGLYFSSRTADITEMGANIAAFLFLFLPGAVVLLAAFGPATRRWLRSSTKNG